MKFLLPGFLQDAAECGLKISVTEKSLIIATCSAGIILLLFSTAFIRKNKKKKALDPFLVCFFSAFVLILTSWIVTGISCNK